MTDAQLDQIEASVGFLLPGAYRRVASAFPFRPIGRDAIYWFHDDPERVVEDSLNPLDDGGYDLDGWREGLLGIGHSASGDVYVLDTRAEGLPVLCLCHETHALELAWPTFEAFVAEWQRAPEEIAQRLAASNAALQADQRSRMTRGLLITLAILLACLAVSLSVGLVAAWRR